MAQITRIVAFGCSHTYGHGLEDCIGEGGAPGPDPSKMAWPSLLAQKLKISNVCNMGVPGVGNKFIAHSLLNFNLQKTDLVVVLWSFLSRRHFFKNSTQDVRIVPWEDFKHTRYFHKNFDSDYDQVFESSVFANYIDLYLKEKNLFSSYGVIDNRSVKLKFFSTSERFVDVDFRNFRKKYPTALDNLHMGQQAHIDYADIWHKHVTHLYPFLS